MFVTFVDKKQKHFIRSFQQAKQFVIIAMNILKSKLGDLRKNLQNLKKPKKAFDRTHNRLKVKEKNLKKNGQWIK